MTGITLKDCPEFDAWLITEQEMWNQRLAGILHTLIAHYRNSGDYEQGLKFAARFLAQDHWREEAHREMMLMLALSGQRTAALAQYEKCCDILVEDLGVNPSAETTALYYRIRNGEIRNKNTHGYIINYLPPVMDHAQPILPVVTPTAVRQENNGNGVQLHPYMADEGLRPCVEHKASEFDQILERIANPVCRLLTLVGPHNEVQKRLLFEVMTSLTKAFRHGVCFVSNSSGLYNSLLVDIAYSLNLTESDLVWNEGERAQIWLFKQLREKELLLVINDVEQYSNGVFLLEEILKRAPMMKLLVSAKAPLQMSSEWIFDIY